MQMEQAISIPELDLVCEICPKCGTPTEHIIELFGKKKKVGANCKCRALEVQQKKELELYEERMRKLERLRAYSLMDESFKNSTFENWDHTPGNQKMYKLGKEYCDNWEKMKADNVGMTIWGSTGIGKSYLSFCIANELLSKGVAVIATSSINLINQIYESYGKAGEMGEVEIIRQFENASLVIIDDLGAEHNGRAGKEKQIIYSVIDARVRAKKPLIITTNLSTEKLRDKMAGADGVERTYDRMMEACPPIQVVAEPRREAIGAQKTAILRGLLN